MAAIAPLHALHYDQAVAGPLQDLWAPPYDVIDPDYREQLAARSPHNAVRIDLPQGEDPYAEAARTLEAWEGERAVVRDAGPAIWALEQSYRAPDGRDLVRQGLFCRVRVEEYGAGRIRPHERTHPGPKEDRLRLTRATRANLSPIFSLFSDAGGDVSRALAAGRAAGDPWGEVTDDDGNRHRLWRIGDPDLIAAIESGVAPAELLIADGHHRYETARVYAQENGAEAAGWVLMCLVALEDPGLTVFPTHRLVRNTTPEQQEALAAALRADWEIEEVALDDLVVGGDGIQADGRVRIGYLDAHFQTPYRLTLKDPARAQQALPGRSAPYRRLDTAVTEALLLKGPLELTDEHIDHLDGFGYARDTAQGIERVRSGEYDLGFFMGPTPVEEIAAVAAEGESMPPKSTYFFPKILTGLLFNPLV